LRNVSGARISGKFLSVDGGRFLITGVSYGTFAPDASGALVPDAGRVSRDFDGVAELGANTVRTYTPPPIFLLDEAWRRGLRVMAGVPWPQHLAFLDSPRTAREIRNTVAREVRRLASHPASLLFAIGNEIPPSVVRWHERRRIEKFLRGLFEEAKAVNAESRKYHDRDLIERFHHHCRDDVEV
jgi:beta-galactosidase/beta-glucuronidase